MKTIYIDVYFLINFTVDILAVFIALKFSHIRTTLLRLIASGIFGAIFAIIELFLNANPFLHILLYVVFLSLLMFVACIGASFVRRLKFIALFFITAFAISGLVNFVYGLLDIYLKDFLSAAEGSAENRKILIFSLIILLVIGVFRILIMVFSNSMGEKSTRLCINIDEKRLEVDALIDSGNLVKDPMNMNPVLFLKEESAAKIFPKALIELSEIDKLNYSFKKRIRLIPVTRNGETHVMTGVRVDSVSVYSQNDKSEEILATVVIDKEGGTFGGYEALLPYAAIQNVI